MMGRGENMKFTTKLIYYILILIPLYFIFKDNASIDMIKAYATITVGVVAVFIFASLFYIQKMLSINHICIMALCVFSSLCILSDEDVMTALLENPTTVMMASTISHYGDSYEQSIESFSDNSAYPTSSNDLSSELVWYDSERAIKHHLQPKYLNEINDYVVHILKGNSTQDTAWNIVTWEDDVINYDYTKANNNNGCSYTYDGNNIVAIHATEYDKIQTPKQTIERRKGICIDYAILTAALLLKNGYQPVYIFETDNHAFAAIKINGKFYAIDQHPPIVDIDKHLNDLQKEHGKITAVNYYGIQIRAGKTIVEKHTYNWIPVNSNIKSREYDDLEEIIMNEIFKEYSNYYADYHLDNLDDREYLPNSYIRGTTLTYSWEGVIIDDNLKQQYAKWIAGEVIKESSQYLLEYDYIWIKVLQDENTLYVKLYLAKR